MPTKDRLSVSLSRDLVRRIRSAARRDRSALSAWLADAAEAKLLLGNAARAIAEYEKDHGAITDEEMDRVDAWWRGA